MINGTIKGENIAKQVKKVVQLSFLLYLPKINTMVAIVHPDNPNKRKIQQIVDVLNKGGVIIYPTDTVYSLGCSLQKKRAIEKLAQLKGIKLKKANFSIVFNDLSHLAEYTKPIDRPTYKILNRNLLCSDVNIEAIKRTKESLNFEVDNNS